MTESKITNPVKVIISDSGRSFVCEQWVGGGRAITPESQLFAEEYHAIADALNRVPQLEAENERLRKRCEKLESSAIPPPEYDPDDVAFRRKPDPITRRDLFAAAALASGHLCVTGADKLANRLARGREEQLAVKRESRIATAEACYQMADAMLAEDKKGGA